MAHIIVLNGTSSSGKSSIVKALQESFEEPYLHLQLDMFWDMVPKHIEANSNNFANIKHVVMDTLWSLNKHGMNVILDTVVMPKGLLFVQEQLKGLDAFYVYVHADLDTLKEREKNRGDRKIGLAESQKSEILKDCSYDIHVDTTHKTAEEAAQEIIPNL
tara:strand:+ start:10793 stop:11272 length:480 start_codon:yes stop_codon:yes gene_type:complete